MNGPQRYVFLAILVCAFGMAAYMVWTLVTGILASK